MTPQCLYMTPQCLYMTPQCLYMTPQCLYMTPQCLYTTPECLNLTPQWPWLSGLRRSLIYSLKIVCHCVLRNWDRILARAVISGLISRAGMVSICPLLWQRDVKLQQTKPYHHNAFTWHHNEYTRHHNARILTRCCSVGSRAQQSRWVSVQGRRSVVPWLTPPAVEHADEDGPPLGYDPVIWKINKHIDIHVYCMPLSEKYTTSCFGDVTTKWYLLVKFNAQISRPLLKSWSAQGQ